MQRGDSGGGVFSPRGTLLGMAITCDSVTHEFNDSLADTLEKMGRRYTSHVHFLPATYLLIRFDGKCILRISKCNRPNTDIGIDIEQR